MHSHAEVLKAVPGLGPFAVERIRLWETTLLHPREQQIQEAQHLIEPVMQLAGLPSRELVAVHGGLA